MSSHQAYAEGEDNNLFISLRAYIAEKTMGSPENMAYVAARCAALNNVGAGLANAMGNEEFAEAQIRRSEKWVMASRQQQADALGLPLGASEVTRQVADEMAIASEGYLALLTGSSAAGSSEASATLRDDVKVCAVIYEAFGLGG